MTTFYFNPFALISFVSFLIMMTLAFVLWHKYYTTQTRFVLMLFIANAIYSFFYTFEISFRTLDEITWFYRLEYLGIPFLGSYYLMFALDFSGRSSWLTAKNKAIIFIIPVITVLLVFSNEHHYFFYAEERMNYAGPFPSFSFKPGFWYFIHQGYVLITTLISFFFLGKMLYGSAAIYRRQLLFLLMATVFPFMGYLAYQLHLVPFGIDPVSFTFTLTGITIYIALARFKLFDLVPIARTKLFEKIQEAVVVFDVDDRMIDYNQNACQLFNISKSDLSKNPAQLFSHWPELVRYVKNNHVGKLEVQRQEAEKSFFYNIQVLELENDKLIKQGKMVVVKDISDLINSERERTYTASKLDAVINAMPDMMFVLNSHGVVTDFFASDTEKFFLSKEEVIETSLHHLFNMDEAESLLKMLSECLKTSKLTTYQFEMSFPGMVKHYEARISRLDEFHVLAIIRDVTESNEMKQNLIYQSGFQKILMQLASRFIYISSSETDTIIVDSLRQIAEYIGVEHSCIFQYDFEKGTLTKTYEWSSSEQKPKIVMHQNLPMEPFSNWVISHQKGEPTILDKHSKKEFKDPIVDLLASDETQSILAIPMISQKNCMGFVGFDSHTNKRQWFDSEISLLKIFTGMLANLQEKIIIERSLVEARIKAEASNKLKTAFMNNISHEIRTPLNGIIGFGEIIANEQLSLEEKNQFLTVVQESSERLIQTIDDYLDISMLVTGTLETNYTYFTIAQLIDELVDEFTAPAELKNLKISSLVPEDLKSLSIYSDYDLIRKVLHHLTGNSLKFTVQGSISLGLNRKENAVSIFVQDTGIGIAENAQKYVFDSFMQEDFSSTRLYEGSGLGLSIVNGIVKLLGGEITLASTKGKGTLFSFTVPINSR